MKQFWETSESPVSQQGSRVVRLFTFTGKAEKKESVV